MNAAPSASAAKEYFISRAGADKALAQDIAEIIREAGAEPFYQDEDFGHADFMRRMEQGYARMARMVALLSPEYQKSEHCRAEYNHVLGKDPANLNERLVVLRVADCQPEGNLQNLAYTDLVPVPDDATLRRVVRVALGFEMRASEIDFSRGFRRAGHQMRHPEVRGLKDFTGRDDMLKALGEKLWRSRATLATRNSSETTLALRGLGGVGKTMLAQAYAWQNWERYHAVWWIRADTRETVIDDLMALGRRFIPGLDAQEPEEAAQTTLDRIAQMRTDKPWLLVYDNVDDQATIRRLTPPNNAHVLITTRLTEWHAAADELPVDVFDYETAITYLLAPVRNNDQQREAAGRLADALQRLPLALSHARSYCRARNWSFDQYIERLPELIKQKPKSADYPATVFATFSLAIEKAAEECAEAERLMGLLAFFAPDQVPLWLIPEAVLTHDQLGDALAALSGLSLLTLENLPDGTPSVSVHRLVQEVMRGRLTEAGTRADLSAEATRLVEAAYDASGSFDAPQRNTYFLAHALAVLVHAPRDGNAAQHTLRVLLQSGDFRLSRGETSAALAAYRESCDIAGQLAQTKPRDTFRQHDLAISHRKFGEALVAQGNPQAALAWYEVSLAIASDLAKADLANSDWQREMSLGHRSIGDALAAQGKLSAALESYSASLAIGESLVNADPGNVGWLRDLSKSYWCVADIEFRMWNLAAALGTIEKGHRIRVRLVTQDGGNAEWQSDLSSSHFLIGQVLFAQHKLSAALESYSASLAIRDHLAQADPGHAGWQRDLSLAHRGIGDVLFYERNWSGALATYQKSLAITDGLAKTDPRNARWQRDLSLTFGKIGRVFLARDNLPDALVNYRKSLAIADRLARAQPGNVAWETELSTAQDCIGDVLAQHGDLSAALKIYSNSLTIIDRLVKANPENAVLQGGLASSHIKIGGVLFKQRNEAEALTSYQTALAIADRLAKAEPGNADWQRGLAECHGLIGWTRSRQGDRVGALRSFRQGGEIVARLIKASPDHVVLPQLLDKFDKEIKSHLPNW
jgi:tetratricopeptide (TPR) repeat protein